MKTIRNLLLCLSLLLPIIYFTTTKAAVHTHTYATATKAATCTSTGYTIRTCRTCGYKVQTTIAKKSHSYTVTSTKAATCTSAWYKISKCKTCNQQTKTTIAKLSHTYKITTNKKPTCTEDGYVISTCTKCGNKARSNTTRTGHTLSVVKEVKPTCTKDGSKHSKCKNCTYEIKQTITITRTDHSFVQISNTKISNNVSVKTYDCKVCHKNTVVRYNPALKGFVDKLLLPEYNIHINVHKSCKENNNLAPQAITDLDDVGYYNNKNGKHIIGDHNYEDFLYLGLVKTGTVITFNGVKYKCIKNEAGTNIKTTLINSKGEDVLRIEGDLITYTCEPTLKNPDGIRLLTWKRIS